MDSLVSDTLNKRLAAYNPEVGIYIFGTGQGGQAVYKYLNSFDYRVKGFFDNNDLKQGTRFEGIDISTPMAIAPDEVVVISSLDYGDGMFKQLVSLGLSENQIIMGRDWLDNLIKEETCQYTFKVAHIDIVDTCNLRCATCPRSSIVGTGQKMDLELFCKILNKLQKHTPVIGLYNWSECFLHPELLSFVKEIKKRSRICYLSSNLALPSIPQLRDVMDALQPEDGDHLIVSISGLKQNIYEINHVGGNIETVKKNIEIASSSRKRKALTVRLIHFDYNQEEADALVTFCEKLGVSYELFRGFGNPLEKRKFSNVEEVVPVGCRDPKSIAPCELLFDHISINVHGDVTLCCGAPPHYSSIVGSFLEMEIADLMLRRYFHPYCSICSIPFQRRALSTKEIRLIVNGLRRVSP